MVLEELRLVGTGDKEAIPESRVAAVNLRNGWFLITAGDFGFVESLPLGTLSLNAELVTCAAEEHVMASFASGWRDGAKEWTILHDAQIGRRHLQTEGALPPSFAAIRDKLFAQQTASGGDESDTDYVFDIPVEVAHSITGYRHYEYIGEGENPPFERLEYRGLSGIITGLLKGQRRNRPNA